MDVQLHRMQRRQKVLTCSFGIISDTVAKCPHSMFLLQEVMLSQPGHRTAQRLRWVFSCPGQTEAWGVDGEFAACLCWKTAGCIGRGSEAGATAGASSVQSLFLPGVSRATRLLQQVSGPCLGRVVHHDLYPRALIRALSPASGVPGR